MTLIGDLTRKYRHTSRTTARTSVDREKKNAAHTRKKISGIAYTRTHSVLCSVWSVDGVGKTVRGEDVSQGNFEEGDVFNESSSSIVSDIDGNVIYKSIKTGKT